MEMLNMGKNSWFRIYSCNYKEQSILRTLSCVYQSSSDERKLDYKPIAEQ